MADLRMGSEWCSNGLEEPPLGSAEHSTTPKYLWRGDVAPNTGISVHTNTLGLLLKILPTLVPSNALRTHFQRSLF